MAQQHTGFVAYPSSVAEVRQSLSTLPMEVERRELSFTLKTWETNDVAGYCLIDPIVSEISTASFVLADITRLNFNVVYEIGYTIGKGKRVVLVRNDAIKPQQDLIREIGVFDTLGHRPYHNAASLCQFLPTISSLTPLKVAQKQRSDILPFFVVWPNERTEAEIRLLSRIKKQARAGFRQFDPKEEPRLSIDRAIDSVASSNGIILPLISGNRRDAEVHNLRCAFVAGLAQGLAKETLILQAGFEPVPLDYRDAVAFYTELDQIDKHLGDFTPKVFERALQLAQAEFPELTTAIQKLHIGQSAAENEHDQLAHYYIQTEQFQRALRGEVQVVTGRKGSGKTALFYQLRNRLRGDRRNIVLDLNPEGFQLHKFKTLVLGKMEEGTQEHTATAFWEYLLFLELCHKLLEKDRQTHLHNHVLRPLYLRLQSVYENDPFVAEGDFAERLLHLVQTIEDKFAKVEASENNKSFLTRSQITEFLYQHDINLLRSLTTSYLQEKGQVWILFDNIDKGWSAHGVDASDLQSLRCLMEALRKLSREFRKNDIDCHGIVFIRNDIFEILVESTPDRGKINRASLDWTDADLLAEMLRRRFIYSLNLKLENAPDYLTLWQSFAAPHFPDGTETAAYVLSRSLMRPRSLIDFLHHCQSHAVNLGHSRIEASDILEGEKTFSTELVSGISLEIEDVFPRAKDALFAFIEAESLFDGNTLRERLGRIVDDNAAQEKVLDLLFWYGFLGFVRSDSTECYIYSVVYDMKKFKALLNNVPKEDHLYTVNPAFFKGLEIKAI